MGSIKRVFLLAVVIAGLAIFLAQVGYNLFILRRDINRTVEEKLYLQAQVEAQRLSATLDEIGAGTEYFANAIASMDDVDHPQALAYLKSYLERYPMIYGGGYWFEPYYFSPEQKYYGPYMYKAEEKAYLTWDYSGSEYDYFSYDWYDNGRHTGLDIVWTEPFVDVVSKVDMITGTSAIRRKGEFIGVTTVDVSLQKLQEYVQGIRVGQHGFAFIIAGNDRILTDNPPFRALISDADQREKLIYSVICEARRPQIQQIVLNRQKVYLTYAPISSTNMYFGLVMPEAEAMGAFYRALEYNTMVFLIMMAIIFVFFGILFKRRVAKPLDTLVAASDSLKSGDLAVRISDVPQDEFGKLAISFNAMAEKLAQQFGQLQHRLEFEQIVSSISSNYIDLQMDNLGGNLEKTLGILAKFMKVDRAFIAMLDDQNQTIEEFFEWHAPEVLAGKEFAQGQAYNAKGAGYRQLLAKGVIRFTCLEELPEQGEFLIADKLRPYLASAIGVSFILSSGKLGVLGLASRQEHLQWADDDVAMLKIISEIFANAIQRKDAEARILKLARFDRLTGLRNRMYFEQEMERLRQQNVADPALLLFDIDGLKLINDTYGHSRGDELLLFVAQSIATGGYSGEISARVGGDEFAILLPEATEQMAELRCQQVKNQVAEHKAGDFELFISLSTGYALAPRIPECFADFFREADNYMYREKLHHAKSNRSAVVQTLMKALEARDFITEGHAVRLEELMERLARHLGMSEKEIADMRLLAQFHDIGKVGIPDSILMKPGPLTEEEYTQMQRHSEIGYHIAQASPDLAPIADWILMHHERWDGSGAPLQLAGEKIPLACRMLAIADAFDAMTSDRPYRLAMNKADAIAELQRCAGTQFDPAMVVKFLEIAE